MKHDIEKLDAWRKKSIFTAPSYDFEPSNSSDLLCTHIHSYIAASPSEECAIVVTERSPHVLPATWERQCADARFIAEARTSLPYYIDRTETATKLLKRVGHMQKVRVTGDEEAEAWGSDWDELVERIREFLGEEERHDL